MDDRIPPFLTVEEAAALLKIGRTKAYLLTQEYRSSDGRSGLPVVDLGDLLRVPGTAIERMLNTGADALPPDLGKPAGSTARAAARRPASDQEAVGEEAVPTLAPVAAPVAAPPVAVSPPRRPRRGPADQLPLFQQLTVTNPNTRTATTIQEPKPTTNE